MDWLVSAVAGTSITGVDVDVDDVVAASVVTVVTTGVRVASLIWELTKLTGCSVTAETFESEVTLIKLVVTSTLVISDVIVPFSDNAVDDVDVAFVVSGINSDLLIDMLSSVAIIVEALVADVLFADPVLVWDAFVVEIDVEGVAAVGNVVG